MRPRATATAVSAQGRTTSATMHRLADGAVALVLADRPPSDETFLVAVVPEHDPPARRRARACAELARGVTALGAGAVTDALASLTLARSLLGADAPRLALGASVAAADAAWAAGDRSACVDALAAAEGLVAAAAHDAGGLGHLGGLGAEADYVAGMRALLRERPGDAVPRLRRVLRRRRSLTDAPALLQATVAALLLGDVEAGAGLGARALAAARLRGDDGAVAQALEHVAYAELRAGRHARARSHAVEGFAAAVRTGRRNVAAHHRAILALAAADAGDAEEAAEHVAAALATAREHGLAQTATLAQLAAGRLELAQGRPADAAARLADLVRPADGTPATGHFAVRHLVMPSFVEAAVAAGRHDDARAVTAEYAGWAAFGADPVAPALLARCRALLGTGPEAEDDFRRALELHAAVGDELERARTRLLFGEWLRRRRRPSEARDQLRDALRELERCGGAAWAERAAAELRAAGTAGPGRGAGHQGALARLTPHQRRIADLVADGGTNREIAHRLSVSARTVEHHLRHIFVALGVRSRVELTRLVLASLETD
ncbi:LuxR C-terminal-related transcriptional regulator [Isoptericola sp. F-RaC21]|uniref:LuxR C-terminal-related transcriptional regulator n=1 Tax=Isoptericola sp. F-RaC21 TaxID=3141452 RepID=UPI00315BF9DA